MTLVKRQWKAEQYIFYLWLLPLIFASPAIANTSKPRFWHPIIIFTSGAVFNSDAGQSKYFPPQNGILSFYHYSATHKTQRQSSFGGFIGAEFLLPHHWILQTGFSYDQYSPFIAKGFVTQGVDVPSSNQYAYKYAIKTHQFLIENKFLYPWRRYYPYLSLGVGAASNHSYNYVVDILPLFTTFSPQFMDKTNTSLTYTIGFGIDMNLTPSTRLGLGYRFTDLGAAKTGKGVIDNIITNNQLSQLHLCTNEILAQLTIILL